MIINCPHCGKQVRVLDEGAYRCPLCLNIFEFHPEQPTAPAPGEDASPLSEYQPPDEETMPPRTESGEPPATEEAPVEEPSEGPAEDASIEEPSRETPALPFPTWETAQEPFVAEEPSAGADVCEVCRRRPAKHVCHETGLLLCDDCAVTDAQGRPLWRDRQPVSPPLESSTLEMIAGLIRQPDAAFAQLQPNYRHLRTAVLVALYGGVVQIIATTLYGMFIPWPWDDLVFSTIVGPVTDGAVPGSCCWTIPFSLLALPFSLLFTALLFHFFHRLVGSGRGGWAASLKVILYAELPMLLYLLPIAGPPLAAMGSIILATIGGARVHGVSRRRALIAILLLWTAALLMIGLMAQMSSGEMMSWPTEQV